TRTKDRWYIGSKRSQNHTWRDFITVWNVENTIKPVGIDNRFSSIRDNFTRRKAIAHPNMPHSNPVINTNGVKFKRNTTHFTDSFLGNIRQFTQMHVPRNNVNVRIANGNKWLLHIFSC